MDSLGGMVTHTETEMSVEWARHNPDLFADAWRDFFNEHADGWTVRVEGRAGFVRLIATRALPAAEPTPIEEDTMSPIKVQIDGTSYSVWLDTAERDHTVDDLASGTEYRVFYCGGEWHFQRYVKATRARRGGYIAISPRTSHKLCARLKQAIEKAESTFTTQEA